MRKVLLHLVRFVIGIVFFVGAATTALGGEFYKGKMLRFIVGSSPGGGFDTYARLIGRHIGKHIPGNPNTLVANMTGAGNLVAANFMFAKAKPDGLTIGHWVGQLILQQVLGLKGVKFDARKFEWIGVPTPSYTGCVVTKASGITSVEEWLAAKRPVKLGGMAPGTTLSDVPRLLKSLLGLPIKLIEGYGGAAKVRLAVEVGEVSGGCWNPDVITRFWRKQLASGEMNIVLQAGLGKHRLLPDVPNAIDYAKKEEGRQLIQVALHNTGRILRAFSLPPGTPKDRVKLLRKAFMATMRDPEFLAETKKAKLPIDPLPGEQVAKLVSEFFELKPDLAAKLKGILIPR